MFDFQTLIFKNIQEEMGFTEKSKLQAKEEPSAPLAKVTLFHTPQESNSWSVSQAVCSRRLCCPMYAGAERGFENILTFGVTIHGGISRSESPIGNWNPVVT